MSRLPPILAIPLVLVACNGQGDSRGDSKDTSSPSPVDTGPHEVVYPSGDRILVYKGHGGVTGKESGWGEVEDVDAHWKEKYGWNTDWRDYWDDLSVYRAIFFMDPGAWGSASWTEEELSQLRDALAAGTRMVVLTEEGDCSTDEVTALLEGLGARMRFTGEGAEQYSTEAVGYLANYQVTDGVHELYFSDPCYLELNGADYLMLDRDGNVLGAVDRPADGGDVVAIGDFEFLDDDPAGNVGDYLLLADRLVEVVPGYSAGGEDTGGGSSPDSSSPR